MESDRGFYLRLYCYGINSDANSRANENIINRTVCYLDPPFCHCEIQFMNEESLAVYANSHVVLRRRTFDDPQYVYIKIPCTRKEYDACYTCANVMVNLPFSWMALINCKLKIWHGAARGTFCSKLCCDVLNAAKILHTSINSNFVTPSALYTLLKKEMELKKEKNTLVTPAIDFQI